VRRQTEFVKPVVGDGERALSEGHTADAALALYKAQLGGPKNKRLLKVMQETGAKGLVQKMELDHIRGPQAASIPPIAARHRGGISSTCSMRRATRST